MQFTNAIGSEASAKESSIGIFDSGVGGLTVMSAIRHALPHENIIYFGDTARLPYGTKSAETVLRYAIENTSFLISQGVKVLVVACHTACCAALKQLKEMFDIPIIGVVMPSMEKIIQNNTSQKICILGTRSTIASKIYQDYFQSHLKDAEIFAIACPLFVPLVEEGYVDHLITELTVEEYLFPLDGKGVDTLLLGCTHFPLLAHQIQKKVGLGVDLIDPAQMCAQALKELLEMEDLLHPEQKIPHYQFYVSDDPERFKNLGQTFLKHPIQHVTVIPF